MGLGGTITSTIYREIDCGNGSWEFKFWLDEENSDTTIFLYGNTEERYLEIAVVRNVGMEGYFFVNSYAGGEPDTIGYLMPPEITSGWHTLYLYIYDSSVVAYLDNESSLIAGNTAITENKSIVVWEASNRSDDYTDEVLFDYFNFAEESYSYLESYDYEVNPPDITGSCLAESISCESNFSAITPNVSCGCTIDSLMYESMYESMVPLIHNGVTTETVSFNSLYDYLTPEISYGFTIQSEASESQYNLGTPSVNYGATVSAEPFTSLYDYLSASVSISTQIYALTQTSTYTQINPSISTSINLTSGISNSNFNALSSDIKCGCTIEINTTTTINIETQTPTLINGCTTTLTPLETQYLIQSPIIKINLTTHTTPIESYYDILTPEIYTPPSQVYKYKFIIDRNIPLRFTVDKNKKYQFIVDPKQNWVFIMEDNE